MSKDTVPTETDRSTTMTGQTIPVALETEEDYRNAPYGTIVAENGRWPYIATKSGWADPPGTYASHAEMTGLRRRVLRWGWEA